MLIERIDYEEIGNEHLSIVHGRDAFVVNSKTGEACYTLLSPEMVYGDIGMRHISKITITDKFRKLMSKIR